MTGMRRASSPRRRGFWPSEVMILLRSAASTDGDGAPAVGLECCSPRRRLMCQGSRLCPTGAGKGSSPTSRLGPAPPDAVLRRRSLNLRSRLLRLPGPWIAGGAVGCGHDAR